MRMSCALLFLALTTLAPIALADDTPLTDAQARDMLDEVQRLSGQRDYHAAVELFSSVKLRNEAAIASIDGLKMAAVLADMGNREDHEAHCRWLIARHDNPVLATDAERSVKGYVIVPWADDPELIETAVERCRFAVERATEAGEKYLLPWFHASYGIALYRAGEYSEAAHWLQSARDGDNPTVLRSLAAVFHTMAHHQRGETAEARNHLLAARALVSILPEPGTEEYAKEWTDTIVARMALAEADALLRDAE